MNLILMFGGYLKMPTLFGIKGEIMRKSIKSIIGCIAGGLGMLCGVYFHYRKSERYNKRFKFANKMLDVPDNLEIVNLGTTNAYYGFDYSNSGYQAMNMAGFTQTFAYDLKVMRHFSGKVKKDAAILIPFVYPIFLVPQIPNDRLEVYNQFARFLSLREINGQSRIKTFFYSNFPFLIDKHNRILQMFEQLEKTNGQRCRYTERQLEGILDTKLSGWYNAAGICEETISAGTMTQEMEKRMYESIEYLQQLVDFCFESGWHPIFVILPYSELTNKRVGEQFIENVVYRNLKIVKKSVDIPILDYSRDDRLASIDNYMDAEFLNEAGRKKFTKIVLEDTEDMGFLNRTK